MKLLSAIIASGSRRFKKTKQYREQRANIRIHKTLEYRSIIIAEKNIFTRLAYIIKREIEIMKEIRKLDSLGKMYLSRY